MNRFRTLIGILSFGLAVAALIVLLKVLNWFPAAIQNNMLREYSGIEQVKSTLRITDIFVPSYFPEQIGWPPSKILAQDKPFPAVLMEFKRRGTDQIVLVLSQSKGGTIKSEHSLEPVVIKESAPFTLHNSPAMLVVGECSDHEVCSMITWNEGGYTLSASMRSSPFDLRDIAKSMRP